MLKKSSSVANSRAHHSICIEAKAKVNLSLFVTGRREDGLHDLVTTFASVAVCDSIVATPSPTSSLRVSTDVELIQKQKIPKNASNLLLKGDIAFRGKSTEYLPLYDYELFKDIPAESGLGGGSADCAAVLRLLNSQVDTSLPDSSLKELALSLGADIPFCLFGGFCLGTGAGEKLEILPPISFPWKVLLIRPFEGVSTGEAFRQIGAMRKGWLGEEEAIGNCRILATALSLGDTARVREHLHNDFLTPFLNKNTENRRLYDRLSDLSDGLCCLSGSGSVLFGLFQDDCTREEAWNTLKIDSDVSWLRKTEFVSEGVRFI